MKDFSKLEDSLGIKFNNKELLTQAFIHRSYLNEHSETKLDHNERLEFLGDAVLEIVVTEFLYKNYKNPEGDLTSWRASLVNSKILSRIAYEIGFNDFILLSKGEQKDTGRARQYILANAMESFIGSLYLDRGIEACNMFIKKHILKELPKIIKEELYRDPKSLFQEIAQDKVGITPSYDVLEESGPDHAKTFIVGVYLEKEQIAKGGGPSKQEAQEKAAQEALEIKKWNNS